MLTTVIPQGYAPLLNLYDTQKAIGLLKRLFEDDLGGSLNLRRVSAPLFVEASTETIIKRYKETRRGHPLAKDGRTLVQAAELERAAMAPVRKRAEYIIDTTALSTAKLHGEVLRLFGTPGQGPEMSVSVVSFGFKYGVPIEADLVFDVRCLPNPFYIAELRRQTGLDAGVRDFLWGYQQTADLVKHLEDLMSFLLPLYVEEGKSALVIAIGCTGGQHRSVAITRSLADFIRQKGYNASENHRDMTRALGGERYENTTRA